VGPSQEKMMLEMLDVECHAYLAWHFHFIG